jgi:pyruvate/2-oxoglutarate dehydrogenase complex dihydrolipoamide dehydrogenase (E3) component
MVLQNALFPGPKKKLSDLVVPWVTYTDPEVAHVGLYDWEAEKAGISVDTYVQLLADTDRGRIDGEEEGFVKIHLRRGTDQILGATIVGRHAGEWISEVTVAMSGGLGLRQLATVIHPYPTAAAAIRKVADAYNRTRLTPTVARLCRWWFGWRR